MHACVCIYIYVNMCVCVRVHVCESACICVHVCVLVCVFVCDCHACVRAYIFGYPQQCVTFIPCVHCCPDGNGDVMMSLVDHDTEKADGVSANGGHKFSAARPAPGSSQRWATGFWMQFKASL